MSLIEYVPKKFKPSSLAVIEQAAAIIEEYREQGYQLTLRQLYYQFVSRDLMDNTMRNYKNLGSIVNDARLAGELDWEAIEDRTRNVRARTHWESPAEIVEAVAEQYHVDYWLEQETRVEVWIEKDALVGVIEKVCWRWDVPYFACRGYSSQSEQWRAGQRFVTHIKNGQSVKLIHLGDHDPSGIDMTRDNEDRLRQFIDKHADAGMFSVERIALNMDQVKKHRPPPNPAKLTDSRVAGYMERFGSKSWELDALNPNIIEELITDAIEDVVNKSAFDLQKKIEAKARAKLVKVSKSEDLK